MYQQTAICCTLNNVPMTAQALKKSRLPFGIHLYPFAYDETIPVSSERNIVRCSVCRAYINPYIRIGDQNSWQCNLCNRLNQMPGEFVYDYENEQYYDLGTKAELTSESVEFIAPIEYMARPPPPACYMFVFDCSKAATEVGYIPIMATAIVDLLDQMPGDSRASIGFIAFDSNIHYFSFIGTEVMHHVCPDVTTSIAPCPSDGILVNMTSKREMILDFLTQLLPTFPFEEGDIPVTDPRSALGPAVKAAVKILSPNGGKITVIQAQLPNHGCTDDGSILVKREDPFARSHTTPDKNGEHLTPLMNPASDYYKSLALECSEHHISVDIFNLSTSYADLASVGPLAKFSAGSIFHYSNTLPEREQTLVRFDQDFRNNLVRQIGLESVLRVRFTRGLKVHTFHGNCFVRSANLLTLANANPDASYTLQIAYENELKPDTRYVYFQVSVLFTTPEGERRIRVHTARYPTANSLPEIIYGANQTAITAMLAKMAVDRSLEKSIGEAKEALINAGVDLIEIYSIADEYRANSYPMGLPENLRMVPLYILALMKHIAFKVGPSVKLDDRFAAMERFKTLPVEDLLTYIYPDLIPLHNIATDTTDEWKQPLSLSAAHIERNGAYLLDAYDVMIIYIFEHIDPRWCYDVFGVNSYQQIPGDDGTLDTTEQAGNFRPHGPNSFISSDYSATSHGKSIPTASNQLLTASKISGTSVVKLAERNNTTSRKIHECINFLIETRPTKPKFYVLKDNSKSRTLFTQYMIDDRSECYHSYTEFCKFLQNQARK